MTCASTMTRLKPALLLLFALTLSACGSPMNKQPDIKFNPHPRQRYELTVSVDAPGAFDSVKGYAFHQVSNASCVPQATLTGARNMPNISHVFALTQTGEGTFRGYFYLDQFKNDNYFDLGVCHVDLMSVGPDFSVHGETFNTALMLNDVLGEKSRTTYFSKKEYFEQTLGGAALEWRSTDESVAKNPEAYFSITVTVTKDTTP